MVQRTACPGCINSQQVLPKMDVQFGMISRREQYDPPNLSGESLEMKIYLKAHEVYFKKNRLEPTALRNINRGKNKI